jgi:hypothetical protein
MRVTAALANCAPPAPHDSFPASRVRSVLSVSEYTCDDYVAFPLESHPHTLTETLIAATFAPIRVEPQAAR